MKTRRGKDKGNPLILAPLHSTTVEGTHKLSPHKSGHDWKLNSGVQVKVHLENKQSKTQSFSSTESHNHHQSGSGSGVRRSETTRGKKVLNETNVNVPSLENCVGETREVVVFDFERNCIICHEYIRRFTEHIREAHQEHEFQDVEIVDSTSGEKEGSVVNHPGGNERGNIESVAEIIQIDDFHNPDSQNSKLCSSSEKEKENPVSVTESTSLVSSGLNENSANENNIGQPDLNEEIELHSDPDSDSEYEPDYPHKNKIQEVVAEKNSHEPEPDRPLLCKICNMKFRRQSNLTKHLELHRMRNENSAAHYKAKFAHRYPCPKCSRICNSIHGLRNHYHHAHKKFLNQDLITEADIDINDKSHSCHLCDKSYTTHKGLWEHCRRKHKVLPKISRMCIPCDLEFSGRDELNAHTETVHSQIEKNGSTCNICDKIFANNYKLSLHKRVHTGDKPFMCEKCSKCFPTAWSLKKHYNVHVEENGVKGYRPFVCDKCGARFTRKISLTHHSILKHTVERPHVCEECGKRFKIIPHLKKHRQAHLTNKKLMVRSNS